MNEHKLLNKQLDDYSKNIIICAECGHNVARHGVECCPGCGSSHFKGVRCEICHWYLPKSEAITKICNSEDSSKFYIDLNYIYFHKSCEQSIYQDINPKNAKCTTCGSKDFGTANITIGNLKAGLVINSPCKNCGIGNPLQTRRCDYCRYPTYPSMQKIESTYGGLCHKSCKDRQKSGTANLSKKEDKILTFFMVFGFFFIPALIIFIVIYCFLNY